MEKKKGTHLVLSGKVCGREEKRFDGEWQFSEGIVLQHCSCSSFCRLLHCCCTAAAPVVWDGSRALM